MNKRYVTPPTVSLEEIPIISFIDTAKNKNVVVVDIPGLFLTADMDKIAHMVLRGRLPELMAQVNPSIYSKYMRVES